MVQRAAIIGLALTWLATVAWGALRTPSIPQVLSVERLQIVEADGTPALVMANSQRPSPATIDGLVLMK